MLQWRITLLPLRDEGVLVIGSGNIVHNLGLLRWHDDTPHQWACEFNALVTGLILEGNMVRLTDYPSLGDAARLSIPTREHYLPLLYALALRTSEDPVSIAMLGFTMKPFTPTYEYLKKAGAL